MWRHDVNRSAATPEGISAKLFLQWALTLPPLEKAWTEQANEHRLTFDEAYAPIVSGHTMFICSSVHDSLHAYDTRTGVEKWHFYADAPMRLAPVAANGGVYVVSDDGCLYCLDAGDGSVRWKFRGAPDGRQALGNKRMGSIWPARGGPVLFDGQVYFTAGIWPFMGIFVYALDAATGEITWVNSGSGSIYCTQPHGALAFGSLAPQGYLALLHGTLLLPNSRTGAAALDSTNGDLRYFNHGGRGTGSAFVAGSGHGFNNSGGWCNLETGSTSAALPDGAVLTDKAIYTGSIDALDPQNFTRKWTFPAPGFTAFCKAGSRLYAGNAGKIMAIEDRRNHGQLVWTANVPGATKAMLVADGRLFVVTGEGGIYCFGADAVSGANVPHGGTNASAWPPPDTWTDQARGILQASRQSEGYGLVLGAGNGRLMEELFRQSSLTVIGIDTNAAAVEALRTRWDGLGIPAARLSVRTGDIGSAGLPPYFANLIVCEDVTAARTNVSAVMAMAFHSLRPYGGTMCFPGDQQSWIHKEAESAHLTNAETSISGGYTLLTRAGALPGSADWTHQYADAANTTFSKDRLVKAPLGLLWFGGSSNAQILPRHGHGPTEQVIEGRLIIEGPDTLQAMDIYTGRMLWNVSLPGIGTPYDNTKHQPGVNLIGGNYASTTNGIYVCRETVCLRLDPATGRTLATFSLPNGLVFAQVKICGDWLLVAADPFSFSSKGMIGGNNWNEACSRNLFVLNRHTGAVLWRRTAVHAFHHNAMIAGGNRVFCIDRLPPGETNGCSRGGFHPAGHASDYRLLALDLGTGRETWSTTNQVFGTWLGYSETHNLLLQAGRKTRDMVSNEPTGRLIGYNADTGAVLWDRSREVGDGVYALCGDMILMQTSDGGSGLDLLTGATWMRTDPLTGRTAPWSFARQYGCNSAVASENLLTFRSGAAGYYDLLHGGGTGNLGGFKSGCSSSLIAAGGVLNAPDYTRTCVCDYQLQTSLGLIYMPDAEMWTYSGETETPAAPISRIGVNLGAPGNRMSESGTLWLEYPAVGGPSPFLAVAVSGSPRYFRHHSLQHAGKTEGWITASGAIGASRVTIGMGNAAPVPYVVRLFFAEPEKRGIGERIFDVKIQGKKVLANFDIAREAGSTGGGVSKTFTGILIDQWLTVEFAPVVGAPVICGMEAVREFLPSLTTSKGPSGETEHPPTAVADHIRPIEFDRIIVSQPVFDKPDDSHAAPKEMKVDHDD